MLRHCNHRVSPKSESSRSETTCVLLRLSERTSPLASDGGGKRERSVGEEAMVEKKETESVQTGVDRSACKRRKNCEDVEGLKKIVEREEVEIEDVEKEEDEKDNEEEENVN
ncbi:unnamed protein product [Hydatigera taeniaeformis]|uniref:Uncharacterized protein n=1 Tax=Hydatigena taeniaeformis TaxID=6205 RepID=A0A0R3X9N9_HYDTA|nr:unnamed protein product [Hydatigera taeniaeformis]